MGNVIRAMNPLKAWITESREQQRRNPGLFLASYQEIEFIGDQVRMTRELLEIIEQRCGQYDTSFPTGQFCGRMFIRGRYLCWYGVSKQHPMKMVQLNFREIILLDE